jgi:guanylate kinase
MASGVLFVISAPSGAGKSTIIDRIRPMFPDMLYSVSCTTRHPRAGEQDGVHYFFLDVNRFKQMVADGEFLEWKEVHENMYGTPRQPIRDALEAGRSMILDIDVKGALEVFEKVADSIGIFINAPGMEVLAERLRRRHTDSEESIRIRMSNAAGEMALGRKFRYQIINDDLDKAVEELASIIKRESQTEEVSGE